MTASGSRPDIEARAVQERTRSVADLVTAYEPGDLFLRTPSRSLLAKGRQAELRADVPREALGRHAALAALSDAVAGGSGLVVGAIPFADSAPAHLFVPETAWSANDPDPVTGIAGLASSPLAADWQLTAIPPVACYEQAVADALGRISSGRLDKVVLARVLHARADRSIDLRVLLARLLWHRAGAYTFAVPLQGRVTFIGASPELLVRRVGDRVRAFPLAGSAPRSTDPREDAHRADALLASAKDQYEHRLVATSVVDALRPLCSNIVAPITPTLMSTPAMWHLGTEISATLADHNTTALDLAIALHPTPAVCGTPVAAARTAIADFEAFDRRFFAGTVGWMDADGDGEWSVALRCAEADGNCLRLFAGAGIVAGSVPSSESAETLAKFSTLLRVLDIDIDTLHPIDDQMAS